MNRLTANEGKTGFETNNEQFPILRAQCLLTGSGDINKADLIPSPPVTG